MSGVARRLLVAIGGVIASSVLVFVMLRVLPGDIATTRLGVEATPDALAELRSEYGFDRPLVVQYVDWMRDAASGDLGNSLVTGDAIRSDIVARLDVTLPLVFLSSFIAVALAMWVGRRAAVRRKRLIGAVATTIAQVLSLIHI